jgi:hypothetical protein
MYTFGVTSPGAVDSAALGTPAAAPDDTMVGAVVVAAPATAPATAPAAPATAPAAPAAPAAKTLIRLL